MIPYAEKRRSLARRTDATAPPAEATQPDAEAAVLDILAKTLGVPAAKLSAQTPFAELGLNSLLGVRFLDAVNRAFGLKLGVEALFAHGSVAALAAHVAPLAPAPATPAPAPTPEAAAGDVAVIGMAGRFAGAADVEAFWRALVDGRSLVHEVPPERWRADVFHDPRPGRPDRTVSKWAGFLDRIDAFDAAFFNISPREAAAMDPAHRLMLEEGWRAFEDAGYPAERLKGAKVGVYVGAAGSGYEALLDPASKAAEAYGLTGNLSSMVASRIAYFLDLTGPALVVDTACSASLVALDLAVRAIRAGEVEMALVGGVALFLDEKPFLAMTRTGMLSPSGRCRTFDAAADGIAVGEAAAAVVLKPLARALADGDRIDAVIKGTGTNQDGRSNGITAPNPDAQAALLSAVWREAGIDPATIGHVEAHGTGTPLGDPVEVAALRTALGNRGGAGPCAIGAVKTNIGHTAEAAGIAGVVKTVLSLRERTLAPSIGFERANPRIDFADALQVVTTPRPFAPPAAGGPRRATVSAFGLSGTNAHAVLEEPPPRPAPAPASGPQLLLLSARTPGALERRAAALADFLQTPREGAGLADVAATLALGRTHFEHRLALVAADPADAAARLAAGEGLRGVAGEGHPAAGEDLDALAARYVAGERPDWPHLWPGARRNVSLPVYPFEPTVHWAARRPCAAPPADHPFADPAEPDRVVRRFVPTDPVVRDHVVAGAHVVHAAVFLEMARLAGARRQGRAPTALADVAWERTVAVPPEGIDLAVAAEAAGEAVALTLLAGTPGEPAARARALFDARHAVPPVDVEALQRAADQHLTRDDLAALDRGAVVLGETFAGLDALWIGPDAALGRVEAPSAGEGCVLPPRLMDAAIQTGAALLARGDGPALRLRYPATCAAIEILAPVPPSPSFVLARPAGSDRVDLTIADAAGTPLVCWSGFEMRPAAARPATAPSVAPATFRPAWLRRPAGDEEARAPDAVIGDRRFVEALGRPNAPSAPAEPEAVERLAAGLREGAHVVFADTGTGASIALLRLVKCLASRGLDAAPVELRVVTANVHRVTGAESAFHPLAATTEGLAKAVGREFPAWRVVVVDVDRCELDRDLGRRILGVAPAASGEPVVLRGGERFERILEPVEALSEGGGLAPGGVHLVVGGTGRVGREVARHLARVHRARLALVGRQPPDGEREAFLAELVALGAPDASYHAADVTVPGALAAAVDEARARHGTIDGAVQAVVDPLFGRLDRTDEAAFAAALAPKVAGLEALAAATAGLDLAYLAVFSSIGAYAGFPGNVGQASYCAACSFEAAFAEAMAARGRPVHLVQWGLWENEAFAGEGLERLRRQGTHPMDPAAAVEAFGRIVAGPPRHLVHASLSEPVWRAMGALARPGETFAAAARALADRAGQAEAADTDLHHAVDAHARALLARTLAGRGLPVPGAGGTAEGLRAALAVLPRHGRLFAAVLDMLARPAGEAPSREALIARAPSLEAPFDLLETCVAALPDVLGGEREATDVLFPGGSMERVEAIYRDQPVLAACNAMVAAAARAARPARILEVGAGTGATADAILAALDGATAEYVYTDVSAGFVRHARQRLSDPRLSFAVLDIERDPAEQGIEAESVDLVVATNVLHATRDIAETLENVARLLRPGGLVLVNEMTVAEDFATLTFGLLDGWWRADDPDRRLSHGPLLDVARWRTALRLAGFDHVHAAPAPGFPDAGSSPQAVLLAAKAEAAAAVAPAPRAAEPARAAPARATAGAVEALVRERVAAGLDLSPEAIDPETPFADLGVDSIVAPQIAEDINRAAGIALRSTDLFNFSTVRSLAAHVAEAFPDAALPGTPPPHAAPAPVPATAAPPDGADDAIAIVGMAGRFPDADDVAAFWDNILAGRSAVREIDRFDLAPWYDPEPGRPGKTYAKWAATLADHDRFDPLFFAISPAEAEAMDPQQRLLLETAWHALENAGLVPAALDGTRCGVFVGASANSYHAPAAPSLQSLGGSMAILSARLSYFLNLKGPTFPVDTGCSSSLVALHLACRSLASGESDVALAGGVSCNLLSPPIFLYLADAGMASPTGACRTFDDGADGFAPGEGVGVVVLKRLADARADGDRVLALVRGTGINQDGRTSGLTAPSATSQAELLRAVYRKAGIDPSTIGLVEAHGTGTRLGDPIEVAALTDAFRTFTDRTGFCAIGSVKTNIGHAMAAAGMAGLVKAVEALRHKTLPPTLNFERANRHISFEDTPFRLNLAARPWEADGPRRAAVSSFGFSGTNAHVVLEEAPPAPAPAPPAPGPFPFVLSAKTEAALDRRVADLSRWLAGRPDAAAADVAHTLAVRRAHHRHRRAFVAGTLEGLAAAIAAGEAPAAAGPHGEILARYLAGEDVDFGFLAGRLVDLPGYPFARERFWNPVADAAPAAPAAAGSLGPDWLTGDHVIGGRALLPGAAFLELARAAAPGAASRFAIRDVLWSAPVDATDGDPGVSVSAEATDGGHRCVLSAGGRACASGTVWAAAGKPPDPLDLAAIAARCPDVSAGEAVYRAAAEAGFSYGPAYRVLAEVAVGTGEALARLSPPPAARGEFVFHPALLDGAFQAAACVVSARTEEGAWLPFALEAFEAFAPIGGPCVVHARLAGEAAGLKTFDLAIAREDGTVLALARGLRARAARSDGPTTLLYEPVWRPAPVSASPAGAGPVLAFAGDPVLEELKRALPGRRIVQVTAAGAFGREGEDRFAIDPASADDYARLLDAVAFGPADHAVAAHLWALDEGPPADPPASLAAALDRLAPDTGVRSLALLARAALAAPEAGLVRIVHGAPPSPLAAAAAAFARTVALESSRLSATAATLAPAGIPALARELGAEPGPPALLLRDGERFVAALEEREADALAAPAVDGATVIAGGAGAFGLAVARHLAASGRGPIALLGRRAADAGIDRALAEIEASGADVLYLPCDVASGAALRPALATVRRRFGPITGVIHLAGVLSDGRVAGLTGEAFEAAWRPKVHGALALDHATRDDSLSVFLMASSTAAAFGSAGQAAYAAANAFLEGFAAWRERAGRPGRTVAVGWPALDVAGMAPPPEVAAELTRRMGLVPMPAAEAMAVLDRALAGGPPRLVALHGRAERLRAFVAGTERAAPAADAPALPGDVGREAVEDYLKAVVAAETKLSPARIAADEPFEAYGIDSMMIVRMNGRLEADLGDVPKTLFFEHRTVAALAARLGETHAAPLAAHLGTAAPSVDAAPQGEAAPPADEVPAADVVPGPAAAPVPAAPRGDTAIAVVGLSGLYPMANDLDRFWRNLADGLDCIVEIPEDRWPLEGFYDPDRERAETSYSKWGGFIDGHDRFDARFFAISPREADALDPQARKFLEVAWATMEDAGRTRETLFAGDPDPAARPGGVFVGVMYGDYQLFGPQEAARGNLIAPNAAYWNVANRVSHVLDLHGPSLAVDTACSSSLSAIHLACAAIRNGDCIVAFAGGVNLTIHPSKHWILSKSGFASSDGRCRSFGAGGDGYVPGEGVGAALLKPLERAVADGDRIHAVIRSSALNHGGRTSGYTVPNPVAQGRLVRAALERAGLSPEAIGYVEAHGTGTMLGDPVEIAGLARAFEGVAPGSCPIGSVKSNIGHLEGAAGIAALTKVVLQFRHETLAPSLHADTLNPNLDLSATPFVVQRERAPWPRRDGAPRRAGVSSFGAGGANAHVVLEEPPALAPEPAHGGEALIVPLSAATAERLAAAATRLADWLEGPGADVDVAALARTLQVGREAMRHRLAVAAATPTALARALRAHAAGTPPPAPGAVAGWLAGERIDWDALPPGPRRPVSLPTYPFEPRRCWVELSPRDAAAAPPPRPEGPRPVACPVDDPLVADHRLGGRPVLAGAFLLSAAAARGAAVLGAPPLAFADVRFERPVEPAMAPQVAVEADGRFAVTVDGTTHASGRLSVTADGPAIPALDLGAVRRRLGEPIDREAIYRALSAGGADYGPAYRLLDRVRRGEGEALAALGPGAVPGEWPANLLDALFQLTFAFATEAGGLAPFSIDRIAARGTPGEVAWAYGIRREAGPGFVRLDLSLLDGAGEPVVAVNGFVARALSAEPPLRILRPAYTPVPLEAAQPSGRCLVLAAADDGLARDIAAAWPAGGATLAEALAAGERADHVWFLTREREDEAAAVCRLARTVRHLAEQAAPPAFTVLTRSGEAVRDGEAPDPAGAAVAAFARSVRREHPELAVRVLDAGPDTTAADLIALPAEPADVALRNGTAWAKHLEETTLPPAPRPPWRQGGAYLIAGGAGGIGLALAEHLVRTAAARVALVGRRAITTDLEAAIARIGGDVLYLRADVADRAALSAAVDRAEARLGPLAGAFHLALHMHDARAVTLTDEAIRAVLAPKTDGTRNLIAALGKRPLDFLVLFSSSNAHTTNPGQSAYAAASAGQDAVGLGPAPFPVRIVDWGFWGEVGRVATAEHRASLGRIGVYPIRTAEGFETVERLLASPHRRIVPLRISEAVATALDVRPPGLLSRIEGQIAPRVAEGEPILAPAAAAFRGIDGYAAGRVILAFQEMGAFREAGDAAGADLAARLGILPRHARLLDALLDMLVRAGFLAGNGAGPVAGDAVAVPAAERRAALARKRARWLAEEPSAAPYLDLLDACADHLPAVLTGETDPNDVLFPGGRADRVEPIYKGNRVVDHFQEVVAEAALAAVRERLAGAGPDEPVRVIEVGAGTGGTTGAVLAALEPHADRVRYLFTDVGRPFLEAARARHRDVPWLEVAPLDVERDPAGQGIEAGGFDVVIAANVLHATREVSATLANVHRLLRPGGVLLLNEATARQDFNTLTFGLTRGWWLFEDGERRIPHTPLLEPSAWLSALAAEGFADARVLAGGPGALQSVLAAVGAGAAVPAERVAPAPKAPAAPPAAGRAALEERLRATVAKALRLSPEEVEAETSFADYGADSIISVDLVREINAAFDIDLKTTALFNYSTVRALAGYIESEFPDRFGAVEAPPEPVSRLKERSERLRAIIRKRRRALEAAADDGAEPPPAGAAPAAVATPAPAAPAPDDDGAALADLLERLKAGEIDVAEAMRRSRHLASPDGHDG